MRLPEEDISSRLDRARELRRGGRLPEALALFEICLRAAPDSARGHAGYAFTLLKAGRLEEAIRSYRRAIRLRAGYSKAWNGLGDVYLQAGDVPRALNAFERGLRLNRDLDASNFLFALNYAPSRSAEEIYRQHTVWGRRLARGHIRLPHANLPNPERILKIGYVSAYFCRQTTYSFFSGLLAEHDRSAVHITCYDNTEKPDEYSLLLRKQARWRSIRGLSDEQAASLVRKDGIDILVDLSGHTGGNRLPLFALQPAPVQVTYLGYPNTTGLRAIDYRFTDAIADPPGRADRLHTEKLFRLPRCFLAYAPFPDTGPLSECPALSKGAVTFGSFSNPLKWNRAVVDAWSAVLRRVRGSRLILHHAAGGNQVPEVYDALQSRILKQFTEEGISAKRIQLIGFLKPPEHFTLYREVDLLLDPFPYNGTTAVCEGLWMGIPSIALTGATHVSRVATSLLTAVGLENFAAPSVERYIELAVATARDVPALAALRTELRERMARSPLMDSHDLARAIEDAYRQMWRRWRRNATKRAAIAAVQ